MLTIRAVLLVSILAIRLSGAGSDTDRLEREVVRLAKITDGVVGLSALHIESNRRLTLHGEDRFPMASSFKVPIAVQLLARADRGEVRLDQMVNIETHDLHPGSGTLTSLFSKPGVSLRIC